MSNRMGGYVTDFAKKLKEREREREVKVSHNRTRWPKGFRVG